MLIDLPGMVSDYIDTYELLSLQKFGIFSVDAARLDSQHPIVTISPESGRYFSIARNGIDFRSPEYGKTSYTWDKLASILPYDLNAAGELFQSYHDPVPIANSMAKKISYITSGFLGVVGMWIITTGISNVISDMSFFWWVILIIMAVIIGPLMLMTVVGVSNVVISLGALGSIVSIETAVRKIITPIIAKRLERRDNFNAIQILRARWVNHPDHVSTDDISAVIELVLKVYRRL